jgi:nucleoside-diphosphate-sugar epimerase
VNLIWQGDANSAAIEMLPHASSPPFVLNVTGSETLSVRTLATELANRLGKTPHFDGTESSDALLSDARRFRALLGSPQVGVEQMLDWTAQWVRAGGSLLNKPTHFETRDGAF